MASSFSLRMARRVWRRVVGAIFRAWPTIGTVALCRSVPVRYGERARGECAELPRRVEATAEAAELPMVQATDFAVGEVEDAAHVTSRGNLFLYRLAAAFRAAISFIKSR